MRRFRGALLLPALLRADAAPDTGSCTEGPKRLGMDKLADIHEALRADGAVILTGLAAADGDWEAKAAALPFRTFPDRLVSKTPKVKGIHLEHAELKQNLTANPFGLVGKPLLPHTDGYIYGKFLPDYISFVVESQSEAGGENYVVDGESVLRRLCDSASTTLPDDICTSVTKLFVDLTERSPPGFVNGRSFTGPLITRQHNRLRFHRQSAVLACEDAVDENGKLRSDPRPYQSLWAPLDTAAYAGQHQLAQKVQEMLQAVDAAVQQEAALAHRFLVREGEALLIDNYRVLHGREGYAGSTERKLWRVWFWTNESSGLPQGMPELGSVVDADALSENRDVDQQAS